MRRLLLAAAAVVLAPPAAAQIDELDALSRPSSQQGADELDALSRPSPQQDMDELDALSQQSSDDPFAMDLADAPRRPVSVTVRALDKITARYVDIEATIGEPVRFASLEILPRFCDKRPPEEFPETTAFLEVFDRDLARARSARRVDEGGAARREGVEAVVRITPAESQNLYADGSAPLALSPAATRLDPDRIFSGWMFASTPALNALEHPIYDVWVIDCKTVAVEPEAGVR